MHELELVADISVGRVTIIFELDINEFTVVKDKLILVVIPIEELTAVTLPLEIVDVSKV